MSDLVYDITDKDIQWTQEKYLALFGIVLNREEALRETHRFVRQMHLFYRPITKQQVEQLKNKYEDKHNEQDSN